MAKVTRDKQWFIERRNLTVNVAYGSTGKFRPIDKPIMTVEEAYRFAQSKYGRDISVDELHIDVTTEQCKILFPIMTDGINAGQRIRLIATK